MDFTVTIGFSSMESTLSGISPKRLSGSGRYFGTSSFRIPNEIVGTDAARTVGSVNAYSAEVGTDALGFSPATRSFFVVKAQSQLEVGYSRIGPYSLGAYLRWPTFFFAVVGTSITPIDNDYRSRHQ